MKQEPEVDYAHMYHRMVQAAEKAIDILTAAQKECEEQYIRAGEWGTVIQLHDDRKDE